MNLSPQQDEAAIGVRRWMAAGDSQVFYLAGYAGTGKTTLARLLANETAQSVCYAAFTGKAALVLQSKGCDGASTIHSLIYKADEDDDGITRFRLNKYDSAALTADLIVIDEVSMVGPDLGRDLLSFGKPVLVLGDPAQLPPVDGTGFFTSREPDYLMTEIHRQAADNPIIRMSMDIREGKRLTPGAYGASQVIPRERVGQRMVMGVDQVIVGLNRTRQQTNAKIRRLMGRDGAFVAGDRVVCLKNNKDKGLLNGGLWTVRDVEYQDADESHMVVKPIDAGLVQQAVEVKAHHAWIRGRERELPRDVARNYDPFDFGYALTCHKSQGSQWDSVLVFDESFAFRDDRAKWLYTAVTRAAERVIVAV